MLYLRVKEWGLQGDVGLGRRNNELNELTNCCAADDRGSARAESPTSSEPRASPWVSCSPHLRPVRAKVINNRCAHTFALTGRGALYPGTQGVALGWELAALSGRSRRGLRGIAPERGSYSRIGARPYLPPQLINSRCCPCKGRISWAGLAPQHLSRYEPLTGARFINRLQEVGASPYPKYEPPSGALAPLYQP